jgi:predicted RNase H-like HicB family nuclease
MHMSYRVEIEHEEDGRWIADVVALPGAMAYGASADEAIARATALALRVLADRIEHGEIPSGAVSVTFEPSAAA